MFCASKGYALVKVRPTSDSHRSRAENLQTNWYPTAAITKIFLFIPLLLQWYVQSHYSTIIIVFYQMDDIRDGWIVDG
jgi:hypothetical protein